MTKTWKLITTALVLWPTGCVTLVDSVANNEEDSSRSSPSRVTVSGLILSSEGDPIPDAQISSGGLVAHSYPDGSYSVTLSSANARLVLDVQAPEFGPSKAVVAVKTGVPRYERDIVLPAALSTSFLARDGASLSVGSGSRMVTVKVPPSSGATGMRRLVVAGYDAMNGPGALDTPGPPGQNRLQSQGMIHFVVLDAAGQKVAAPPGMGPRINIEGPELPEIPEAGDMQQWAMDARARWINPGPMSDAGGADFDAQAEGYWNADRNYRTACVRGRVEAPGKTCGGIQAEGSGPDGIASRDSTSEDGSFCVEGAQTFMSSISVGGVKRSVRMPSEPGNCSTDMAACADLGTIMVEEEACPTGCPTGEVNGPDGCHEPSAPGGGNFDCSPSNAQVECDALATCSGCTVSACGGPDGSACSFYTTSNGGTFRCDIRSNPSCLSAESMKALSACGCI